MIELAITLIGTFLALVFGIYLIVMLCLGVLWLFAGIINFLGGNK